MRPLLVALVICGPVLAQENRPLHNTSFVPADDEKILALVEEAQQAAAVKDYAAAADLLQRVILTPTETVLPLRGRELYTGARRWAQIRLLAERDPFPRPVLDSWRKAHDARAAAALLGAIAAGDERALADLLDRYPAATAAPFAILALSDRAWQRGDRDRARGFLLRLPEHLARSEEQAFLESDAYTHRRAFADAHRPAPPRCWPTIGGDATRARNGDPIPPLNELRFRWAGLLLPTAPATVSDINQPERASAIMPFSPICDERHIFVHLGSAVAALSRKNGRLLYFAPSGRAAPMVVANNIALGNPGLRGATLHDGVLYFSTVRAQRRHNEWELVPFNELVAFDVGTKQTLWRCGPWARRPDDNPILQKPIFFRGAPAVVGDRLYAYGAVREFSDDGPTRKEEAHVFCFAAKTGKLLWHRFLGYGDTDAPPQLPPVSGLAPAVSQGVVVVVSGLGVAAALDADSGEVIWLSRYDRRPLPERMRLRVVRERWVTQRSGWMREAPRILGDYVHFAPYDGDAVSRCWLRGRRRPEDGAMTLVCWSQRRDRDLGRNCLLEYIAGFHGGRGYYVGVRDPDRERWGYENVVSNDLLSEVPLRFARLPATVRPLGRSVGVPPPLFGRPVIAGDTLLIPTRRSLYAFDLGKPPRTRVEREGTAREIPPIGRFDGPVLAHEERDLPPPVFGNLVAVDGWLYAVTRDRVIAYGPK
ncbi:MAG: outer membrane protein assembly factor BamB family protein [Planctomycetota bacterium]